MGLDLSLRCEREVSTLKSFQEIDAFLHSRMDNRSTMNLKILKTFCCFYQT